MEVLARAIIFIALAGLLAAGAVRAAADPWVYRHTGDGANGAFSDCPSDAPPADRQICHDYVVEYLRTTTAINTGPVSPRSAPFAAALQIYTSRYHAATDSFDLVSLEVGETSDVVGTYDEKRLLSASANVRGSIPLFNVDLGTGGLTSSGRTATLGTLRWTGFPDLRYVFGNNGPGGASLPRHFVNACETENFNAHQIIRPALLDAATPVINGVPVDAPYRSEPQGAIFNNWFHSIIVTHGNC